ncbi:putative cation-transporting ATPase I [Acrocarpospora corrugata]|uniref:Putative cation-transporting ATPase I n=1 Tax=Acrocarpospora corrugata TaxID=35763 RepID=A0A5M3W8H1_9ACTN|nr:cation-translocating P-type ATPase [Acrocarpospora corrugata]GES05126.1 putative cation-transporting ATPase I [Acrocarpospora corrugata]
MFGQILTLATGMIRSFPVPGLVRGETGKIAETLAAPSRRSRRRTWPAGTSGLCVEVRGLHLPGMEAAAETLERRLAKIHGVTRTEVNRSLGYVYLAGEALDEDDLISLIEETESEHDLGSAPYASGVTLPDVPAAKLGFGVRLAGLGVSAAGRVTGLRGLPPAVPLLVSLADSYPWLRNLVAERLDEPSADALFGISTTLANVLSFRPLGQLIDTAGAGLLLAESRAHHHAWTRAAGTGSHRSQPCVRLQRPVPLPPGPIERYCDRAVPLGLGAYGLTAALGRFRGRELALLAAAAPKAARLGRDAFGAELGRGLAGRDVLVLNHRALRRLDRIDTVVVDADALMSGRWTIHHIEAAERPDLDAAEVHAVAHELVDPADPWQRREQAAWTVEPDGKADGTLTLTRDGRPVAQVTMIAELHPLARPLIEAAESAGTVLLAGGPQDVGRRLGVAGAVAGGRRLAAEVRALQVAGHGVAVVSAAGKAALAAADLGIGIESGQRRRWTADVSCDLAGAVLLVGAAGAARTTSRRSAQLAFAGSCCAVLLALATPVDGRSAYATVNLAAGIALGVGLWTARTTLRRPAPIPEDPTAWHAMPVRAVLDRLRTTPQGLAEGEAERRRVAAPATEARPGLFRAFCEELANPLTPVLAAGAGVSAVVGSVADAALIGGVLGVNALIGGMQRQGADRALDDLLAATAVRTRLRREDRMLETEAENLVPGDVIELVAGDAVPADCRLIQADNLEVDESSLTGESLPVLKTAQPVAAQSVADRRSMVYQGTTVAAGSAICVVVAVGAATEAGRSARTAAEGPPTGGVEARLRELTQRILPLSVGAGGVLILLNLLRGQTLGPALGQAVSLAVAAVPEGLPFVASVAELASAKRLSKRGVLVRNPGTIETLGRVDVLCFDKTGTLTEGRIRLRRVSDGRVECPVSRLSPELLRVLVTAVRACPTPGEALPHPTDRAVVDGAARADVGTGDWRLVDELPFEPGRGYHAALGQAPGGQLLSVKGAPEIVLERCARWLIDGAEQPLEDKTREELYQQVDRLARQGYRVLAVAERPASDRRDLDEARIDGLTMLGLVALADPVRATAALGVARLQQAGVRHVIVTGDHPSTAEAIAAELNALNGGRILTGAELDALQDRELAAVLPHVAVFARTTPAQKARIVKAFRDSGRVVAVTGDGANDAPAIRLADVGIALGADATPAARGAADVVVTDDRIETITDAIAEGRAMWTSVRDALAILLGGNLGEVAYTVGAGALGGAAALNARQLLLINLLTDMLPALAVAVRPPAGTSAEQLLAEGPESSLGEPLGRDIVLRAGVTAAAATLAALLDGMTGPRWNTSTIALVALVSAQLMQTMAVSRGDRTVLAAAAVSLAGLGLIVSIPGVSTVFGCRPIGPLGWLIALGSATAATATGLALAEHQKALPIKA